MDRWKGGWAVSWLQIRLTPNFIKIEETITVFDKTLFLTFSAMSQISMVLNFKLGSKA